MFERIANSWELVKASAAVLSADKELLIFPLLSGIGTVVVSLAFFVPMLVSGFLDVLISGAIGDSQILGYLVGFLFYFVQYFVILFANSALVGAAMIRLRGGDPTVRDGLRIAFSHIGPILGYALVASTVGMILRALSRRRGTLGRIVIGLIGLAWNLATFLVVPVLIVEDVGPIEAIRRSAQLLRKTWGEQIAGNLSISLIFGLLGFALTLLIFVPFGFLAVSLENPALFLPGVVLLVVTWILMSLVSSALSGIYSAAVYRYAAEGDPGEMFEARLVEQAFRSR